MISTLKSKEKDYIVDLVGLSCSIVLDRGNKLWDSREHADCVALQVIYIQTGVEEYDETGTLDPAVILSAYNLFSNFYHQIDDDARSFLYGTIRDELSRLSLNG